MNEVFTWPVGHAAHRGSRSGVPPVRPIVVYVTASVLGGIAMGSLLGAVGLGLRAAGSPRSHLLIALSPVVLLAAVCQARGTVSPLPERRAQVPTRWLLWHRSSVTAMAFGAMIGAGVFTRLRHASAWTVAVLVVAAPSLLAAVGLGAIYGAARGLPLAITWAQDRAQRQRFDWFELAGPRATISPFLAIFSPLCFTIAAASFT